MFSSLRNYSKNIDQSQRFYYDNYDYYNIYENLEKDYKDDLSKFIYHCARRNTPVIATYNPNSMRFKHKRLIKSSQQNHHNQTMQDFVNSIIKIFMENNYNVQTRLHQRQQTIMQPFALHYFSPISDIKYQKFTPYKMLLLSKQELSGCIALITHQNQYRLKKLQDQYAEDDAQNLIIRKVQFNYALQLYSHRILQAHYIFEQQSKRNKANLLLLYQFVVEVHRLIWQILNAKIRTVFLAAQPKTTPINLVIHPLMLPITTFLKYNTGDITQETAKESPSLYKMVYIAEQKKPKIVFINLDGRETSHNLRCISTMDAQMMYISFYQEPGWMQKRTTQMSHTYASYEQGFQPNYTNLWQIYSQLIIKQYKQVIQNSKSKILLFPLNSSYVRRNFIQKYFDKHPQKSSNADFYPNYKLCSPKMTTGQQIHSLFEQIVYQQIRKYNPTMIFISYNGQLHFNQEYFVDIVRNCSILSDHRLVLYTNFVHYFRDDDQTQTNISAQDEDQENADKILTAQQFYNRYLSYKLQHVSQQKLYTNISLFLKYGAGLYSMEDRTIGNPSHKSILYKVYAYLSSLKQTPQLSQNVSGLSYINCNLHKLSSYQLQALYTSYINWQMKQNRKDNRYYYQSLVSTVVNQFMCVNITESQLEQILGKRLLYRYRWLVSQLSKYIDEINVQIKKRNKAVGQQCIVSQNENQMQQSYPQLQSKLLQQYLQTQKQKLLAQNLENYKTRKFFYLPETQKSFGQVNCFKFIYEQNDKEGQQIYMQKYTQVIINEQYQQVFIINYRTTDNRHILLHGSIKNSQIQKEVLVNEVKETDQELDQQIKASFSHIYLNQEGLLNQKQDMVFVQFNHCIHDRTLYLFWPLLWNLKQQTRCKLLGVEYKPKRIWKMIKIFQYQNQLQFRYENLLYEPTQSTIPVLPRWGCACFSDSDTSFKIFGGIYDNENDFKYIGTGIHIAQIKDNGKYKIFTIKAIPKSSKNKQNVVTCLRPKLNFSIGVADERGQQQYCLRISGGYGRETTGFFNLFSYEDYDINSALVPRRIFDSKIGRRLILTQKSLQSEKIGKYNVIINNYNVSQIQEKFSDGLKDKFVFEKKVESSNKTSQWQLQAFIDENYRVNQFKTDPKKLFLFGYDRTVRQKIYMKCWSPQLYIIQGIKSYIVNLSLKTEKTSSYVITNYLMPREQDIVSLCLEQDKIYLLSNSPIIHSIDRAGLKFVLYQGCLTNINEVVRKKQIQMITKHSFSQRCEKYLNQKTIFVYDQKIYLVGGVCSNNSEYNGTKMLNQRQDYVLQTYKNKFKIKTRRIQSSQTKLDMPNCFVVKQTQSFYNYSIVLQDQPTQRDEKERIQWKIKIQKFNYQNNQSSKMKIGGLRTYVYNMRSKQQIQKCAHSSIEQPKLVLICPYKRFNLISIRQLIAKIVWRIDKNQFNLQTSAELATIIRYHNQTNDKQLAAMLESGWNNYQQILTSVKKKVDAATEINFQQEQLLKDLKILYELITKMVFEKHLCLTDQHSDQYIFVMEDKSSKKVKYIAVGPLYTTKINFFKFRFKNELLISLNHSADDSLFYHPMVAGYNKYQYQNIRVEDSNQWNADQVQKIINVSIKQ